MNKFILLAAVTFFLTACSLSTNARRNHFIASGKTHLEKHDNQRAILDFKNALQLAPSDANTHYLLGQAYQETGQLALAAAHFQKAVELNPKHSPAQIALSRLMIATRDKNAILHAQRQMNDLLRLDSTNPDAIDILAAADWALGDHAAAVSLLQNVSSKTPANVRAIITLAKIKVAQNDLPKAAEILQQAQAKNPKSPELRLAQGEVFALNQNPAGAEREFREVLQVDPHNTGALLDLAALLQHNGRTGEAAQCYERLSNDPKSAYSYVYAAYLLKTGKQDLALKEFEKLASNHPDDPHARGRLVDAYLLLGRMADAKKVLDNALEKDRLDFSALFQRSVLSLTSGETAGAQRDLETMLHLRPESVETHYLLAKVYEKRELPFLERQEYKTSLHYNAAFLPARLDLAKRYLSDGDPKAALDLLSSPQQSGNSEVIAVRNWAFLALNDVEQFRQGVAQGLAIRKTPDLMIQSAVLRAKERDYAAAQQQLQAVLEVDPENMRAWDLLAATYTAQGKTSQAIAKLDQYASAHPDFYGAHLLLGTLYKKIGDSASARTEFQKTNSHGLVSREAAFALVDLDASDNRWTDVRATLEQLDATGNLKAKQMLGELEDRIGNHKAAILDYQSVVALDSTNVIALNNLAFDLSEYAHNPDEALKYAERAKELAPDNPSIEDTLGWTLYRKGLFKLAAGHFEDAVAKGKTPQRLYHLGMAYIKCGEIQKGQSILEVARQNGAQFPPGEALISGHAAAAQTVRSN